GLPQRDDALRVLDCGVDFQPVANDRRVAEQTLPLPIAVACDALDCEVVVRRAEAVAFAQDRLPRQAGLIDLEHEPLEQTIVVVHRKAVLLVVIRRVNGVAFCKLAVAHSVRNSIALPERSGDTLRECSPRRSSPHSPSCWSPAGS